MIGVGFLRCFFLGGIMIWYSASVLQTVDKYFRDQFKDYLEKEFENNAEIKKDVMMEAQRIAAKKALIEKIAKMEFAKELDKHAMDDASVRASENVEGKIAEDVDEPTAEFTEDGNVDRVRDPEEDNGETEGTCGPEGNVGTIGTEETCWTEGKVGDPEGGEDEGRVIVGEDTLTEKQSQDEIIAGGEEPDECEEKMEPGEGFAKWRGSFDEYDEVCRFEDSGVKESCADP